VALSSAHSAATPASAQTNGAAKIVSDRSFLVWLVQWVSVPFVWVATLTMRKAAAPVLPRANPRDPCPVCGSPDKIPNTGMRAVGTADRIYLQFTCAVCNARWFLPPVRANSNVHEVFPAEALKPFLEIPIVHVDNTLG
jgi:hypothetical protein